MLLFQLIYIHIICQISHLAGKIGRLVQPPGIIIPKGVEQNAIWWREIKLFLLPPPPHPPPCL